MKQKFEVPYNFDKELIKKLIPYQQNIDFIYLPCFYQDGNNSRYDLYLNGTYPITWKDYISHIDEIQKNNFNIGILIQRNSAIEIIEKYYNLGIRVFILNNDALAKEIKLKYPNIQCILSITKLITFKDLLNNDYSMYDEIVLFFNFCRQTHLLSKLPKKYKYVLMVNSHCIYNCSRCAKHWNLCADSLEEYQKKVSEIIDGYCRNIYREDRSYIPPEDLVYFNDYVYNYKLVDRLMDSQDIINEVHKYTVNINKQPKRDISYYELEKEVF